MKREKNTAGQPNRNSVKRIELMRPLSYALVAVLSIAFILSGFMFARSYGVLQEAIEQERINYVEEISAQIIASQQFMEREYSDTVLNYAGILNHTTITGLEGVQACLPSRSADDILLVGSGGEVTDLEGDAIFFSNRQLMEALSQGKEVFQLFVSLNYASDYWLFGTAIEPLVCDGLEYNAIILAIPAEEFRDSLSVSLFSGQGASYIINNDGSIKIKPDETHLAFAGYNLFSTMIQMGADETEVSLLATDMMSNNSGSFLFRIGGQEWLFSHSAIDETTSIVVAIPLAVTAAMTYEGMSRTIFFAVATVLFLALIAIQIILYFFYRDRKRNREAMAVAAKSDFFSKMSHDIRTPLNAVIGLELLARECSDNPQVKQYLTQSSSAANYLLSIINDVLDMSRIENGKFVIANTPFDMNELIANVSSITSSMTQEKNLSFEVDVDAPFETEYLGDQVRVKQILMNLLSNASKFTQPGGKVKLKVSHLAGKYGRDQVTMVVSDTGIGIGKEYLSRIFTPFEQERSSYTEQYTGSGLGLSIVHNLVVMMGGTVSVESQLGEGSTFTVVLPLERGQKIIPAEETAYTTQFTSFTGHRVLLAEDNMLNQQVAMALLISTFDLTVDVASDGRQAVEIFSASAEGSYDLILMDIKMPHMDGLHATRRIRRLARQDAKSVPIIALSANAFEEDIELSLAAGMDHHLSKPIDINELGVVLNKFIMKEGYRDER